MRILTYNIWNYSGDWRRRRWSLVEAIASTCADIIALQEVRHTWNDRLGTNQARWLAQELGYRSVYRPANTFVPFPPVVEGLAFLSRLPIDQLNWIPIPKTGRGPRRILLRARIGGIDFVDVHYPLDQHDRAVASRMLVNSSTEQRPLIVLGDFNADCWQEPMRILFRAGFEDLWETRTAPASGDKSWPDPRRIDYILALGLESHRVTIQSVGAQPASNGLLPSDHFGILADIRE